MDIGEIMMEKLEEIARRAGGAIMEIYGMDFAVTYKDDESPLTEADEKSNEIICSALETLYPDIPILSEENRAVEYGERKNWEYYWCIDPIDGTKEFVRKNGEFTVNIALIYRDTPVAGVVFAPALGDIYSAKKGEGAFKNGVRLPVKNNPDRSRKLSVVASKSHLSPETQSFIDALDTGETEQVNRGSSLKLCMVAEGEADIYPRLAPTMEWDTAAADAIVREAGRMTYRFDGDFSIDVGGGWVRGTPLAYNKPDLLNPYFVVA
jgi:3'(2'), 5'-bisphosphate nucleotidase